jgi:penicillin V acylase-like amidase (Ntn superfamily)
MKCMFIICMFCIQSLRDPFACTSIVVQSPDGQIYHGRNLDWPVTPLHYATIIVDFIKDGEVHIVQIIITAIIV